MAEEIKQKLKMDELKKRFREVEGENDLLQEKLNRAHKSIKRLRLERSILLERIDKGFENGSDSDTNYDSLSHNDLTMNKQTSTQHHKQSKQADKNNSSTTTTVIKPPKKKKDPNAPKGPGNVFFIFCRHERDKIKEENPEESIGDVTRLLGLKWKGLSREEKKVYYDMFKQEMDEYEEAMKVYNMSSGGANGVLPLEEDDTPRSQSDPAEELATDSVVSSPVSTSTDNIMQQPHNEYPQDEHVYDRTSHHHSYVADAHPHQPLYQAQSTDYMSNNQENHLAQHHHQPPPRQSYPIQQQQLQQQPLQPAFMGNSNTLQKPVMASHPPSAPYDHF